MRYGATAGWRTASRILSQKLTQERAAELGQLRNPRGSQEIFDRGRQTAGRLLCCLMGCWCAVARCLLFLRSQYVHKHKYQRVTKVDKLYGMAPSTLYPFRLFGNFPVRTRPAMPKSLSVPI